MTYKIHVVPHSHWDREWYFTTARSKIYLMKDVKDVLDTLENNPDFKHFMLDAQGSLLDDYLAWRPWEKQRITKLVQEHKLIIGPWYTQSDQLVISGESIVRNLYYGIQRCKEFGNYMNVGYVPDSFGQAANMPQIYQAFGIQDTLFWRGVSDDMSKHTEFTWVGDDGTRVFAAQIPNGYYIGGNIPEDEVELQTYLKNDCVNKIAPRASTKHLYFPNGFDQAPIRKNLPDVVERANRIDSENEYVISCIEDYIKDIKGENPKLMELHGEFVNAKHMRIHKSIFSSRSDLKILNTKIQNYVTNTMEPILAISDKLGNEYPKEVVKDIWKLLFENAAHDSIGSCISDTANEDVYMRYKQARDLAINLVELHMRLIATKIENPEHKEIRLSICNTLPQTRSGCMEVELYVPDGNFAILDDKGNRLVYTILEKENVSDYILAQTIRLNPSKQIYIPKEVYRATIAIALPSIPPVGYTQVYLDVKGDSSVCMQPCTSRSIQNEHYELYIEQNGSLRILDKQNKVTYYNQAILEENGDDGDSFNYSPPRKDKIISSIHLQDTKVEVFESEIYSYANISYKMMVPSNLEERSEGKVSVEMPVRMKVMLKKDSPIITFQVSLENQALSHRVRVLFDSGIASQFHIADQQFGTIKRPNIYEEELNLWKQKKEEWQEMPISIEPMQSFVSVSDETHGIAVLPNGVREYQIVGEQYGTIALTLFRTYGTMGKENLLYRPGRASGEKIIQTPAAQLLGSLTFDFAFYAFHQAFNEASVANKAKQYTTPIEVYQYADFLNGRLMFVLEDEEQTLPQTYSMFQCIENNLTISAIKKCEHKEGYILRLYNALDHMNASETIQVNFDVKEAYIVDLLEEKQDSQLQCNGNRIEIDALDHCKFISIYVC